MVTKKLSKKEIKEHVEKGWVHATVLFELIGHPKKHIEDTMRAYLDNINKDESILTLNETLEDTIELEEKGLYSVAAEMDYLFLGMEKLTWLTFNFMPASIEINAPKELTFKEKDLSNWINDLLSKLHEVNTVHAAIKNENVALIKNINAAIKNSILLALEHHKTATTIAKTTGITEGQATIFLEALEKEKKIKKKGKTYEKV